MIKKEQVIILWKKYSKTVNSIFKMQHHMLITPIALIAGSIFKLFNEMTL